MRADLRRKRVWTVSDFATFMGLEHRPARAMLKQLNAEVGGMLLMTKGGKKPEYTFLPAVLAKAKPELFSRVENLETRVDELEDVVAELKLRERRIISQVGQNTRDVARLRRAS